jgi:hypothetical protein
MEVTMKKLALILSVTALNLSAVGAVAGEFPVYELTGFPITPHQASILGSAYVQEQSPIPNLTLGGMPASPHQITVLAPRSRRNELAKATVDTKKVEVR